MSGSTILVLAAFVAMFTADLSLAEVPPAPGTAPSSSSHAAPARPAATPPPLSASPAAQAEMRSQACGELKRHETELQAMLQQILTENAGRKEFLRKLGTSQRAWLEYRKAHLDAVFPNEPSSYGDTLETCTCRVSADLTKARVTQLREWVDGIAPGNPCAGSRKDAQGK